MTGSQFENTEKNSTPTKSGVDLILQERGSTYGDSGVNLRCMYDLLEVYANAETASMSHKMDNSDMMPNERAHRMAIVMIMGKLARIATGIPHADNYDDIIGYAKIAKLHATGEDYK